MASGMTLEREQKKKKKKNQTNKRQVMLETRIKTLASAAFQRQNVGKSISFQSQEQFSSGWFARHLFFTVTNRRCTALNVLARVAEDKPVARRVLVTLSSQ